MMTQSIPKQVSAFMFGAAGSANIAKRSGKYDFEMLLAGNMSHDVKFTVKADNVNANTKNIIKPNFKQAADGSDKITGNMQDKNTMQKNAIQTDVSDVDNQTADSIPDQELSDDDIISTDILEQVMTMLDQIRNVIMEELNLTPEELDSMMKDLGLELSDLTDPKAIISLVLADSGNTDPLAMLMDEQLVNRFQNLLAKVEDIKNGSGLKLTNDEIKLIMEQTVTEIENDALPEPDETQEIKPQPVTEKTDDENTGTDKDKQANKLQAVSDDSKTDDQSPAITAHDNDSQSKDDNERRAGTDKADGFEMFLDKLSANYDKPIEDFSDSNIRLYGIRDIAQQIINEIRVLINPEKTTMELQLNPEHLGKVNLTISAREGVMTAHFAVQNDLAKEAIESQLFTLKDTLAQQGIKVESIEVTVAGYTFDQKSPSDETEHGMRKKQRSGHKITFEEAVAMSEDPAEENDAVNLTDTMGYNIDYTA